MLAKYGDIKMMMYLQYEPENLVSCFIKIKPNWRLYWKPIKLNLQKTGVYAETQFQ